MSSKTGLNGSVEFDAFNCNARSNIGTLPKLEQPKFEQGA